MFSLLADHVLSSGGSINGASQPSCKSHILRHDCDALGMNGTQVRVLKEVYLDTSYTTITS
jgi:hypothetical protein